MPPKKSDIDTDYKLDQILKKVDANGNKLDTALSQLEVNTRRLSLLEENLNDSLQYSRAHCVKIIGLPVSGDTPLDAAKQTHSALLPILDLAKKDGQLDHIPSLWQLFDMAHKLNNNKGLHLLQVRFTTKMYKSVIMKYKSVYFKTSTAKFSILDDLTKMNADLLRNTKTRSDVEKCWYQNGKVKYILKGEDKIQVAKPTLPTLS